MISEDFCTKQIKPKANYLEYYTSNYIYESINSFKTQTMQ